MKNIGKPCAGKPQARFDEGGQGETCSLLYPEIDALLFGRCHELDVIIPSRAPLAAWLASGKDIHHQRIRDKVLRIKPEILLQHGDPEMLPLETRKVLLRALVDRYSDRKIVRVDADRDLLRRLAHADLAEDISLYILDSGISEDIRKLFLRIASNGKLAGCVAAALQIASDESGDVWLRYYAIQLICDCGNDGDLTRLAEIVSQYHTIPQRICGLICDRLFPVKIGVNDLISLIQRVETIVENASNYLPDELKELFLHNTPDDLVAPLLSDLLTLAEERPGIRFENRESPVSSRYFWLYEPLQAIVLRLLQKVELDELVSNDIVRALILFRHFKKVHTLRSRDEDLDLQAASEAHPRIRRAYAWRRIAEFKARNKDSRAYLWLVFDDNYSLLKSSNTDQAWLLEDVRTLPLQEAQIALELATDLCNGSAAFRAGLKRAAHRTPELQAAFSQFAPHKLKLIFYRFRYRTWFEIRRKINNNIRKTRGTWSELRNRWWYLRNLNELRTGKAVRALHNMYWEARDHEPSADHDCGSSRWQALIPRFGEKIAQAVREGWKASWRAYTPQFPFERDNTGSRDGRITLGQIGIKTEIEDGLDISSLSLDDARILVRYALWETNDNFQQWLMVLANRYPDLVRDALEKCIEAEWRDTSAEQPYFHGTLYQLENAPEKLQRLVLPKTMALLDEGDPQHKDLLKQALTLFFDSSTQPSDHITCLASQRIKNYGLDDIHFLVWLIAWLNLDASGAFDYLEKLSRNQPDNADCLFVSLGSALSEHRSSKMTCFESSSYKRADSLMRFIPLCFTHIRPEEDIGHTSGVIFTRTARDEAQHFRGTLLESLAESKEPHAFQRLQELLDNPILESSKDYVLHLLDQKAENDSEPVAWRAQDVAAFMRKHEVQPRSTDDLYRIALKRFIIIKDSVENADFSQRRDLRQDDPEEALQAWLARQLENSANEIYEVVRESEVDRKKKPDIRLVTAGLDPVTVEVKWAHDWSYNDLEKALYEQLVGLYMKANRSRHGILALATYDAKRQWQTPSGERIGFEQLICLLREHASAILKNRMDIDGLEIVGIDFV